MKGVGLPQTQSGGLVKYSWLSLRLLASSLFGYRALYLHIHSLMMNTHNATTSIVCMCE